MCMKRDGHHLDKFRAKEHVQTGEVLDEHKHVQKLVSDLVSLERAWTVRKTWKKSLPVLSISLLLLWETYSVGRICFVDGIGVTSDHRAEFTFFS